MKATPFTPELEHHVEIGADGTKVTIEIDTGDAYAAQVLAEDFIDRFNSGRQIAIVMARVHGETGTPK